MRLLVLLVAGAAAELTFVAPGQPLDRANLRSTPVHDFSKTQPPKQAGGNMAILLGASAVVLALSRRQNLTSRNVWSFIPMDKDCFHGGLRDVLSSGGLLAGLGR